MVRFSEVCPLKKTESTVERYTLASLSQFLRVFFHGFLSRLLLILGVRQGRVGVEVVTEAFYVPLSQSWICSHGCHCKSSLLAIYGQRQHGSLTFTWSPASALALDHGLWWQHRPRTSKQTFATAQTSDIMVTTDNNMASGAALTVDTHMVLSGNIEHGYQHGPQIPR